MVLLDMLMLAVAAPYRFVEGVQPVTEATWVPERRGHPFLCHRHHLDRDGLLEDVEWLARVNQSDKDATGLPEYTNQREYAIQRNRTTCVSLR